MFPELSMYKFHSYVKLKERLGLFDAIVECNELAIRELLFNIENSTSKNEYIKELSLRHKIKVDTFNTQALTSRIRQFYILSAYQQADQFLDEFRQEHKSTCLSQWGDKNTGEADLDYVLRTLAENVTKGKKLIGEENYAAYQYYRKIRNRFAHSENDDESVDKDLPKVVEFSEFYKTRYSLSNVPNIYKNISFDDFLLATSVIKNIAQTFCYIFKPSNDLIAKKIKIQIAEEKASGKKTLEFKEINKVKNKPDRYLNAVNQYLRTHFGIFSHFDTQEIIEFLNAD